MAADPSYNTANYQVAGGALWEIGGTLNILSTGVFTQAGSTFHPGATLVVGSSTWGGAADYTCDGMADDVQIQAAIDALSTTGGTVVLTAGTFNLANAGSIVDGITTPYCIKIVETNGPIQLIGQGQQATKLFLTNSQAANTANLLIRGAVAGNRTSPTRIADLEIDGNDANQGVWSDFAALTIAYADNVVLERVYVHNSELFGVQIFRDSADYKVLDSRLEAGPNTGLRVESGPGVIAGNTFFSSSAAAISGLNITTNADIDVRAQDVAVVGNTFECPYNGLRISGARNIVVTGNTFRNATHASGIGLLMEGYSGSGNDYAADSCIVMGNSFFNVRNGIRLDIFGATTDACANCHIAHNTITEGAITLGTGIDDATTNNSNTIIENNVIISATTAIVKTSTTTRIRENSGFATEANGTGTIASGATSTAITHGLALTPAAKNISITPTNNPTSDPGNIWINTITATQFTVNCRADPGAGGLTFEWQAIEL